jgi:hypothetical protein
LFVGFIQVMYQSYQNYKNYIIWLISIKILHAIFPVSMFTSPRVPFGCHRSVICFGQRCHPFRGSPISFNAFSTISHSCRSSCPIWPNFHPPPASMQSLYLLVAPRAGAWIET